MHNRLQDLTELVLKKNPQLSYTTATAFAMEFRQKFVELDELMTRKDTEGLRSIVSEVDCLIQRSQFFIKERGKSCFLVSVCLLNALLVIEIPYGWVLTLAFILLVAIETFLITHEITLEVCEMKKLLEEASGNIRLLAKTIRHLDDMCEIYLRSSLFSRENGRFLRSVEQYVVVANHCCSRNDSERIFKVLKSLVIAESLAKFYEVIRKGAAEDNAKAMVQYLAAGLKILLLIKKINENNSSFGKLAKLVVTMRQTGNDIEICNSSVNSYLSYIF